MAQGTSRCPAPQCRSVNLELDVYRFAVENLIYSCISPCEELLVEIEEIDHKESSRSDAEDLDDQLHRFE